MGTTPYEITYGRKPFNFLEYVARTSKVDAAEEILTDREDTFRIICKKLMKAQATMKWQADKKRREVHYQQGEWVLVKLCPHRQTLAKGAQVITGKLAKRYYGPFRVQE